MEDTIPVRVYFNLNRKVWSIQSYQPGKGWRLLTHSTNLTLRNAVTKVSESGRQRVIRERQRNVHAYIQGELIRTVPQTHSGRRLSYNPYTGPDFIWKDDNSVATELGEVVFNESGVFAA